MQLPQWQLVTSGEGLSDPSYVKLMSQLTSGNMQRADLTHAVMS